MTAQSNLARWDSHAGRADLGMCLISGELGGDQLTDCMLELDSAGGTG